MSPGCFSWCSLLIPWKSKITKTQTEVSHAYQIRWCKLPDNYLHQDQPENEPATISTTNECTTVEGRVTGTNPKAAVSGFILTIQHLSDSLLCTGTAWNWTSTDRLDNKGTYLCRGPPSYGDKFQVGGERLHSHPPISLTHIWIQESSDNRREVIPTTTQYIKATGKQALTLLQTAAPFIPVPLIKEAVDVALKIIELCEVCKISLRYSYKMVNDILFPEYIRRQWKSQRAEKQGIPSVEGYSRNFYPQRWKRQWRGYREGGEGYWAGYQGPTQVTCSESEDDCC